MVFINDEPTNYDLLGREAFARTLLRVALTCQTLMVIGINGNWGSRKTSLMRITQKQLEA
jgi:hypothetical protein